MVDQNLFPGKNTTVKLKFSIAVCAKMTSLWFANDDIPRNILSRLSAKKLHNLKNVSKVWHNLVSDRSFISIQLQKKEPVSGFFFQLSLQYITHEGTDYIHYIPIETETLNVGRFMLNFLPENVVIMSLNNGLLCGRSCLPISNPRVYVCNPLNRQYESVKWPNNFPQDDNISIALVFDPSRNPIDKSTDFKLVAVYKDDYDSDGKDADDDSCFLFSIYSSKTGLWKPSTLCQSKDHISKNQGVLVEGKLYWRTYGCKILMFDHQNEFILLISSPIPATGFNSIHEMCIGESQGKLCCVIISRYGLQLWTLKDCVTSKWDLKTSITLREFENENPIVGYKLSEKMRSRVRRDAVGWMDPLAFKDGMLLLRVKSILYLFQFETRMMKRLCTVPSLGPKSLYSPTVVPFTMSLVPIGEA